MHFIIILFIPIKLKLSLIGSVVISVELSFVSFTNNVVCFLVAYLVITTNLFVANIMFANIYFDILFNM